MTAVQFINPFSELKGSLGQCHSRSVVSAKAKGAAPDTDPTPDPVEGGRIGVSGAHNSSSASISRQHKTVAGHKIFPLSIRQEEFTKKNQKVWGLNDHLHFS